MDNNALKEAAKRELLRRRAQQELDLRSQQKQSTSQSPSGFERVQDVGDGTVFRNTQSGNLAFQSPSFSTSNQEEIQQMLDSGSSKPRQPRFIEGAARALVQGGLLGGGDEFVAAGRAALDPLVNNSGGTFKERFDASLGEERQKIENFREERPATALGLEIGGALAAPGLAGLKAISQGAGSARVLKGGLAAAAEGGVFGFNAGEGGFKNRLQNARSTAFLSGAVGGAAPIVASGAKRVADGLLKSRGLKKATRNAPTLDELRSTADKAFEKADNLTGLDRGVLTNAFGDIADKATRKGLDEQLTPKSFRALNRIEDAATSPNPFIGFRELDILRRQSQVPASSLEKIESSIGSKLVNDIDDVVKLAAPDTAGEVAEARKIWGQLLRSEIIDEAFEKARNQASGFENGLRTQFRAILNNPNKRKGFSESEVNALQEVVRGSATSNALKKVGKFGVGIGQQSNNVGAVLGAGIGGSIGGVPGAIAPVLIGSAAQKLSERSTRKGADVVRALVANGGEAPISQLTHQQRLLIESLLRRGARSVETIR